MEKAYRLCEHFYSRRFLGLLSSLAFCKAFTYLGALLAYFVFFTYNIYMLTLKSGFKNNKSKQPALLSSLLPFWNFHIGLFVWRDLSSPPFLKYWLGVGRLWGRQPSCDINKLPSPL